MAINKKLIHFQTKTAFTAELNAGNILDTSIVFIKDTKEIWTHGQLYSCSLTEEEVISLIESSDSISELTSALSNKVDKVTGKGLSTNDYTDEEKAKLARIEEGAQKNVAAFKKISFNAGGDPTGIDTQAVSPLPIEASNLEEIILLGGNHIDIRSDSASNTVYIDSDINHATENTAGIVKVGDGLSISDTGVLSADGVKTWRVDLDYSDTPYEWTSASFQTLSEVKVGDIIDFGSTNSQQYLIVTSIVTNEWGAGNYCLVLDDGHTYHYNLLGNTTSSSGTFEVINNNTLPVASATTLGGIKVGSGLSIASDGTLSATGGGEADSVAWDNVTGKPTFATVATSGSYDDLTDKPTQPKKYGVIIGDDAMWTGSGPLDSDDPSDIVPLDTNFNNVRVGDIIYISNGYVYETSAVVVSDRRMDDTLEYTSIAAIGHSTTNVLVSYELDSDGSVWQRNIITEDDWASAEQFGLVKLASNTGQSVAANSVSSTANRTYAVQRNNNYQLVVNVPWSDTTYSAATTTSNGLMSSTDKKKLNNIPGTVLTHEDIVVVHESDYVEIDFPFVDLSTGTYSDTEPIINAATTTAAGVMSAADKVRVNNLNTDLVTDVVGGYTSEGKACLEYGVYNPYTDTAVSVITELPEATTTKSGVITSEEKQLLEKLGQGSLEDIFSYGVEWNTTVADPHLTRIGNMNYHKTLPIQSKMKGCVAQLGKVLYYLHDQSWAFKDSKVNIANVSNGGNSLLFNNTTFGLENYYNIIDEGITGAFYVPYTYLDSGLLDALELFENVGVRILIDSTPYDLICRGGYSVSGSDAARIMGASPWEHQLLIINATDPSFSMYNKFLNSLLWYIGEGADLTGKDGTVKVYVPGFYIKSEINGTTNRVLISEINLGSEWEYQPPLLIDAYKATVTRVADSSLEGWLYTLGANNLVSVVNNSASLRGGDNSDTNDGYISSYSWASNLGKPATSLTRAAARQYAKTGGKELLSYSLYKNIFYWLYVIEYANFNSQEAYNSTSTSEGYKQGGLGSGVTLSVLLSSASSYYNITPCGWTNKLGNGSGFVAMTDGTKTIYPNRWRGFENPFGDTWTNLDGCLHHNYTFYVIDDPSDYTDAATDINTIASRAVVESTSSGYIKAFNLGSNADIVPSEVGGSTTTYMCDYHYTASGGPHTLLVGGAATDGGYAGLGSFRSGYGVSSSHAYVGFRSVSSFVS